MALKSKKDTVTAEAVVVEGKVEDTEVSTQFIYVGPHIKTYGLMSNTTYIGKRSDVEEYLKLPISGVPAVKELLIPVSELPAKQRLLKERNNSFYNIYKSVSELKL